MPLSSSSCAAALPSVAGVWDKPTDVNSVETWACIGPIIERWADWSASVGTADSQGTKVFALAGNLANTGLVDVPLGGPAGGPGDASTSSTSTCRSTTIP